MWESQMVWAMKLGLVRFKMFSIFPWWSSQLILCSETARDHLVTAVLIFLDNVQLSTSLSYWYILKGMFMAKACLGAY